MTQEHLLLAVGDVIRIRQQEARELEAFAADECLHTGDYLLRRVETIFDGQYLTCAATMEGEVAWDDTNPPFNHRWLSQMFIDRFAKKLMRGGESEASHDPTHR